jgi:hypothetical protein
MILPFPQGPAALALRCMKPTSRNPRGDVLLPREYPGRPKEVGYSCFACFLAHLSCFFIFLKKYFNTHIGLALPHGTHLYKHSTTN